MRLLGHLEQHRVFAKPEWVRVGADAVYGS